MRAVRLLTIFVCLVVASAAARTAAAVVERPAYAAGDRWSYVLHASLVSVPGFNGSSNSTVDLTMEGRTDVTVRGPSERTINGTRVAGVEVATQTTGFLNGTFAIPGGPFPGPASLSGTLTSELIELWDGRGYLSVNARDLTTYSARVTYGLFSSSLNAALRTNATSTVVASATVFPLAVGDRASASLSTDVLANVTVTVFGFTQSQENRTVVNSTWSREALALEVVDVEAGPFTAYRLNQTLGFFPGLAAAAGGNETAWWSNSAGYYVKRVAYVDGTPVAEMRLKSYARANEESFPYLWIALLAVSVAAVVAVAAFLRRRRRRSVAAAPPPEARLEEPPPIGPAGGDGAR